MPQNIFLVKRSRANFSPLSTLFIKLNVTITNRLYVFKIFILIFQLTDGIFTCSYDQFNCGTVEQRELKQALYSFDSARASVHFNVIFQIQSQRLKILFLLNQTQLFLMKLQKASIYLRNVHEAQKYNKI